MAQSRLWQSGTLCITIAANIADTAILAIDACFPDSIIGFVADKKKADVRFVKYLFDALLQKRFKKVSHGAAQDNLSQSKLLSLDFPVPKVEKQREIAGVLAAYDDLIENNNRRIGLLEQAARLLYKDWFVHLRFPGHENVTITNGIPEGWEMKLLGDVAFTNTSSHKKKNVPEILNYIDIGSVRVGRIEKKTEMFGKDAPGRARRIAKHGDTIWSNVRPNLRAYSLVMHPEANDVFSTGFTILEPNSVPYTYIYNYVTTNDFVGHLVNHATGVGYPAVRPDDFERAKIVVPPPTILDLFHQHTESFYEQQFSLSVQNSKLAEARDLLLPRLMNGEATV